MQEGNSSLWHVDARYTDIMKKDEDSPIYKIITTQQQLTVLTVSVIFNMHINLYDPVSASCTPTICQNRLKMPVQRSRVGRLQEELQTAKAETAFLVAKKNLVLVLIHSSVKILRFTQGKLKKWNGHERRTCYRKEIGGVNHY